MEKNTSLSDRIIGWPNFIYRIFKSSFDYYLVSYLLVENWYDAMLMRGGVKNNARLRLRQKSIDGTFSGKIVHMFANIDYKGTKNKDIFLKYKNKPLAFHYTNDYQLTNTITGIKEQFTENQYKLIEVKNRIVLDIGASICDSAIYFMLNGAKRVIALEPYPYTYRVAKNNIRINNLNNKVLLINQACRAKRGHVIIDPNFQNNDRDALKYFRKGKRISVTTLNALVKNYNLSDAILKIDCEGYEYEIIENASTSLLRKFRTIVMEYHYGFRELENKLIEAGFKVSHTTPFYTKKIDDKVNVLCGFIYAERL
jgi:FkbM family methyltransferase